jgi:hypothetical protein
VYLQPTFEGIKILRTHDILGSFAIDYIFGLPLLLFSGEFLYEMQKYLRQV